MIELWGAQGGDASSSFKGGYGGYVSGKILLNAMNNLYITTGGKGTDYAGQNSLSIIESTRYGGYNGGGGRYVTKTNELGIYMYFNALGGGSTDVRAIKGDAQDDQYRYSKTFDSNSLISRIVVAGGGGGSLYYKEETRCPSSLGGAAGGLLGYGQKSPCRDNLNNTGGAQTSGGSGLWYDRNVQGKTTNTYGGLYNDGVFGIGGASGWNAWGGGGGGWYGGGSGGGNIGGGAGGSSYISGMSGSIAVAEDGSPKCNAGSVSVSCSESWTGYKIVAGTALMIDGAGHKWPEGSSAAESGYTQMPNPSGGYYASGIGHSGNGYARITYLGTSI